MRTFHFPKQGVGNISLIDGNDGHSERYVNQDKPIWTVKAADLVRVPVTRDGIVMLTLSTQAQTAPDLMKQIPTQGIDCLTLGLLSMSQDEVEITDKCLAQVGRFNKLQYLIVDSSDASDHGLKAVEGLKNLRGISISATRINGSCFKSFAKLPDLRQVVAQRCNFDESNFAYLSKCPRLEKLDLRWSNISPKGLQFLVGCNSLYNLHLTKEKSRGDAMAVVLGRMRQLKHLHLNDTDTTDRGVESLSSLPVLEELCLNHTKVTDSCISSIKKMKKINNLGFVGTSVTEKGLLQLRGLKLTRVIASRELLTPAFRARMHLVFPAVNWELPNDSPITTDEINYLADPSSAK